MSRDKEVAQTLPPTSGEAAGRTLSSGGSRQAEREQQVPRSTEWLQNVDAAPNCMERIGTEWLQNVDAAPNCMERIGLTPKSVSRVTAWVPAKSGPM